MFCPKCHTELDDDKKFCTRCGTNLQVKKSKYTQFSTMRTFKRMAELDYSKNKKDNEEIQELDNNDHNDTHNKQYNYNKKYSKIIKDNNDSHDIQYNYSKEYSKTNDYEEDHNEQYSYSEDYSKTNNIQVTSDEDYIESYVGKYYKYIKSQTISIYSLLFGEYYLLYRKMYTEGIIIIALNIIIACFNVEVASLLTIIVRLFLAFKFKDIYLNKVEKKVNEIKIINSDKQSTELINIISKNGGTLDLGFLIFIAIFISLFTAAIYDVSIEENNESTSNNQTEEKDTTTSNSNNNNNNNDSNNNSNNNNIDSNDTNIFKDIIVELPSSYKEKAIINKERKILSIMVESNKNSMCTLAISEINDNHNNEKEYLNDIISLEKDRITYDEMSNYNINNINWYRLKGKSNNYMQEERSVIKNNTNLYQVLFRSESSTEDTCQKYKSDIYNNIYLKNN